MKSLDSVRLAACTLAVVALVALASAATGCETQSNAPPASAASAPVAPASATSVPTASAAPAPSSSAPATAEGADDLVGKPAPDFTAIAQNGTPFHLAAAKGKAVVLYFYPKDETPGCTKEACSFRDAWDSLAKTGAILVGISADTTDSHKQFAEHYKLPFMLVTDADGTIGRSFGVPFEGHHQRQTIIVGPGGRILKVYRKVDVKVHAAQVLEDLSHVGRAS